MILEKAYYQQNYQTGNFLFCTYGLGAIIEEGETHQEVYAQLKERVHAQFMADNPHLQEAYNQPIAAIPKTAAQPSPTVSMEDEIRKANDIPTLESFKILAKCNPQWLTAYNETFKRLTDMERTIAEIIDNTEALTKDKNGKNK